MPLQQNTMRVLVHYLDDTEDSIDTDNIAVATDFIVEACRRHPERLVQFAQIEPLIEGPLI